MVFFDLRRRQLIDFSGCGDEEFLADSQLVGARQAVGLDDGFGADVVCGGDGGEGLAAFNNVFVTFLCSSAALARRCGCGARRGFAGDNGGEFGAERIYDFLAIAFARGVECAKLVFELGDALLERLYIGGGGAGRRCAKSVHVAGEAFDFEVEAFHLAFQPHVFLLQDAHIGLERRFHLRLLIVVGGEAARQQRERDSRGE